MSDQCPSLMQWTGYPTLTYDIPLDGYGDRVNLQTLARRTARAVVHVSFKVCLFIHYLTTFYMLVSSGM